MRLFGGNHCLEFRTNHPLAFVIYVDSIVCSFVRMFKLIIDGVVSACLSCVVITMLLFY